MTPRDLDHGHQRGLDICLIASSRFPISEPFAGGLEAHTHGLALELRRRGHRVTIFAAPGSDPRLQAHELEVEEYQPVGGARRDLGDPPAVWHDEHHAYLGLMLELTDRHRPARFDVVHNNSLHHLPIAMSRGLDAPLVTTLHTPPLPWLESAMRYASPRCRFVTVSQAMHAAWSPVVDSTVVRNGIDTDLWAAGPGGERAFWSGRLVPEKAPHEAIDAARLAGVRLDLAGPALDRVYFDAEVAPRLDDRIRYLGHLSQQQLCDEVGRSAVALVTPAWDEPFGLVAAEALSAGTPVAAYARGALPEILGPGTGALARPGDVVDLAAAVRRAIGCDRAVVRAAAVATCSVGAMVDSYEEVYAEAVHEDRAA